MARHEPKFLVAANCGTVKAYIFELEDFSIFSEIFSKVIMISDSVP